MPEMTESQLGHPKFRDPKVFRDGVPQPHKFLSDEPFHVACMRCGAAYSAKIEGKPIHPK